LLVFSEGKAVDFLRKKLHSQKQKQNRPHVAVELNNAAVDGPPIVEQLS
tara:strand:- start:147 stop:293 length:147 start_codon:yes stop_codon:yes gene_type:complete